MERNLRIAILWVVLMVGLMCHSQLELIPIFFGENLVMPNATGEMPEAMSLLMAFTTYTLPFAGLLMSLFAPKCKCWTITALVIAILLAVFHLAHMMELLNPDGLTQFFVMPLNFIAATLLALQLNKARKEL